MYFRLIYQASESNIRLGMPAGMARQSRLLYSIVMAKVKLSIIIPALNEEGYIENLLEDLTIQSVNTFEVIVVNSGSTDKTAEAAKGYSGKLSLTVIDAGKGVARARNVGADAAKNEWLLFLDADVRLSSDFLEKSLQELVTREIDIASNIMYSQNRNLTDVVGVKLAEYYMRLFTGSRWPMAGGFCIWIKRSLHQDIGGFDTKLVQAEDHEYLARGYKKGGKFGYLKNVPVQVSMRRFEEHGRTRMLWRYFKSEIYRFRHGGRIEKDIINYEFGKHNKD